MICLFYFFLFNLFFLHRFLLASIQKQILLGLVGLILMFIGLQLQYVLLNTSVPKHFIHKEHCNLSRMGWGSTHCQPSYCHFRKASCTAWLNTKGSEGEHKRLRKKKTPAKNRTVWNTWVNNAITNAWDFF